MPHPCQPYHQPPLIAKDIQPVALPLVAASAMLALTLITGCSDGAQYEQSSGEAEYAATEEDIAAGATVGLMEDADGSGDLLTVKNLAGDSEQTLGNQRTDIDVAGKTLLITSRADFKVADVVKSSSAIETLTRQQGGYVALSNISNVETDRRSFNQGDKAITLTTYYRQATMTVRIPKAKVTTFLKQIQQQVAFLNEQEFTAQDVTLDLYREQLAASLNNSMAKELSQQRLDTKTAPEQSSNIDAISATYAARRQQEYAKLQRMDIEDKVNYSTIDLSFRQPASSYKETTKNIDMLINAERPSFAAQVATALSEGWEMLKAVTINVIGLWWLLIVVLVFYLLFCFVRAIYRALNGNKNGYRRDPKRRQVRPSQTVGRDIDNHKDDKDTDKPL